MFLLSCLITDIYSFDLLSSGNWGPHLIIVPTSVMLNWEMELKRWCPGFKILTYFGSQKERKLKRQVMSSPVWNSQPKTGTFLLSRRGLPNIETAGFLKITNLTILFIYVGLDQAQCIPCVHHFIQVGAAGSPSLPTKVLEVPDPG